MKKLELVVTNVKHAVVNKKTAAGAALMVASVSPAFAEVDITGAITLRYPVAKLTYHWLWRV